MKSGLKEEFLKLWKKRFDGAELPIAFFYADEETVPGPPPTVDRCLIANLARVRQGTPTRFGKEAIECAGGKRYAGFSGTLTFAVPMTKFLRMVENMGESFLITPTWNVIRKRIVAY